MQPVEATAEGDRASDEDEEVVRVLDAYLADLELGQSVESRVAPGAASGNCPPAAVVPGGAAIARLREFRVPRRRRRELGDYTILREIGRGGMGVVYEAVHRAEGRRVALKVLPFAASLDPRQLQRFKNEAHAASHLQHPHIVPVYEVGCAGGMHFYTMQFIAGASLSALWHQQRRQGTRKRPPGR